MDLFVQYTCCFNSYNQGMRIDEELRFNLLEVDGSVYFIICYFCLSLRVKVSKGNSSTYLPLVFF
jgi:hypothetical protein